MVIAIIYRWWWEVEARPGVHSCHESWWEAEWEKNNVSIIARQDVSPKIDIRRRLWSRPQNLWSGWDVVHLPDTCVFLPHNLSESINSFITSYLLETFVASFWYLRQIFSANSLTHFTNPTFPNQFCPSTLAPFAINQFKRSAIDLNGVRRSAWHYWKWWKYGNNTHSGKWMLVKNEDTRFNCGRGSRWQLRLNFESVAIFLEVYQQDIHQNLFHNILARGWIMEKTVEGGADIILDRSQFLLLVKPTTPLLSRSSSSQVKRHRFSCWY